MYSKSEKGNFKSEIHFPTDLEIFFNFVAFNVILNTLFLKT